MNLESNRNQDGKPESPEQNQKEIAEAKEAVAKAVAEAVSSLVEKALKKPTQADWDKFERTANEGLDGLIDLIQEDDASYVAVLRKLNAVLEEEDVGVRRMAIAVAAAAIYRLAKERKFVNN